MIKINISKNNEFAGMLRATNFEELGDGYLFFTDGGEIQLPTNSEVLDLPETYSNKQKALAWYKTKLGRAEADINIAGWKFTDGIFSTDEADINIAWWKLTDEIFFTDEAPASDFYKERIWSILEESGVEYSFKRDFMVYNPYQEDDSVKVVVVESGYYWGPVFDYIDKLLYDPYITIEITNGEESHRFNYCMNDNDEISYAHKKLQKCIDSYRSTDIVYSCYDENDKLVSAGVVYDLYDFLKEIMEVIK